MTIIKHYKPFFTTINSGKPGLILHLPAYQLFAMIDNRRLTATTITKHHKPILYLHGSQVDARGPRPDAWVARGVILAGYFEVIIGLANPNLADRTRVEIIGCRSR